MTLLERLAAKRPQPKPDDRPEWLKRGTARDFTGRIVTVKA